MGGKGGAGASKIEERAFTANKNISKVLGVHDKVTENRTKFHVKINGLQKIHSQ